MTDTQLQELVKFKSLKVSEETYDKILRCGRMGQSRDDVVEMLCDYYIERELTAAGSSSSSKQSTTKK